MKSFLNSKKLKIALLVLVIILIVFFAVITYLNYVWNSENPPLGLLTPEDEATVSEEKSIADKLDKESSDEDKGDQIIYMDKDEIYSFSFTDSNGIVLGFDKIDDKWIYSDDTDIIINQDRIDKVLNYLCDIHCVDYIENAKGEEYGLDQNSKTFTIQDSAGDTIIISINDDSEDGKIYYAINYDFTTIFINSGKLGNVCKYGIQDLVQL